MAKLLSQKYHSRYPGGCSSPKEMNKFDEKSMNRKQVEGDNVDLLVPCYPSLCAPQTPSRYVWGMSAKGLAKSTLVMDSHKS